MTISGDDLTHPNSQGFCAKGGCFTYLSSIFLASRGQAPLPTRSLRGMVGVRGTDEGALLHSYPFGVLWPSW